MLDAIKPLLDSDLITEATRKEINEAWEAKLNEAREPARDNEDVLRRRDDGDERPGRGADRDSAAGDGGVGAR